MKRGERRGWLAECGGRDVGSSNGKNTTRPVTARRVLGGHLVPFRGGRGGDEGKKGPGRRGAPGE